MSASRLGERERRRVDRHRPEVRAAKPEATHPHRRARVSRPCLPGASSQVSQVPPRHASFRQAAHPNEGRPANYRVVIARLTNAATLQVCMSSVQRNGSSRRRRRSSTRPEASASSRSCRPNLGWATGARSWSPPRTGSSAGRSLRASTNGRPRSSPTEDARDPRRWATRSAGPTPPAPERVAEREGTNGVRSRSNGERVARTD